MTSARDGAQRKKLPVPRTVTDKYLADLCARLDVVTDLLGQLVARGEAPQPPEGAVAVREPRRRARKGTDPEPTLIEE